MIELVQREAYVRFVWRLPYAPGVHLPLQDDIKQYSAQERHISTSKLHLHLASVLFLVFDRYDSIPPTRKFIYLL